jgi:hypothetical protein
MGWGTRASFATPGASPHAARGCEPQRSEPSNVGDQVQLRHEIVVPLPEPFYLVARVSHSGDRLSDWNGGFILRPGGNFGKLDSIITSAALQRWRPQVGRNFLQQAYRLGSRELKDCGHRGTAA